MNYACLQYLICVELFYLIYEIDLLSNKNRYYPEIWYINFQYIDTNKYKYKCRQAQNSAGLVPAEISFTKASSAKKFNQVSCSFKIMIL